MRVPVLIYMPTPIGILVTIYTGIYCVGKLGMHVYKFGCESTPCLFVRFFLTYDILSKLTVKYPDDVYVAQRNVYVAQRVKVMYTTVLCITMAVHCSDYSMHVLLNISAHYLNIIYLSTVIVIL